MGQHITRTTSTNLARALNGAAGNGTHCECTESSASRHINVATGGGRQFKRFVIDISPLRQSRAFRYAYAARTASVLVTGMMLVAASIQLYELTKSSLAVALLNVFMAVPMVIALLIGGVLSDRLDRRKLMMWSRSVYVFSVLLFLLNTLVAEPSIYVIYVAAMIGGAASGISIPAMMSATPALVGREHLASAAALSGLSMQLGGVLGPLLAGVLI